MNLFERARQHSWGRWVWFLCFSALAVYVLSGIEISSPLPSPQLSATSLDSRALNERKMQDVVGIGTRTIASLRVGDRVLAVNPQVTAEERASYVEPDWSDWLQISLVLPKLDGSNLEIEILRTDEWFIEQYSLEVRPAEAIEDEDQPDPFDYSLGTQVNAFPFPSLPNFALEYQQQHERTGQASQTLRNGVITSTSGVPLRPAFAELERQLTVAARDRYEPVGLVVQMDLPELGLTGEAIVTNIQAAPAIRSGNGRVVTATFKHSSGDCISLALSSHGTAETIGTTSNHPFWSVDRQDYVQAGSLQLDERVQTYSGDTKRVISKLARPGPEPVYNLEVHGEHVYYVGNDGVLVHNTGGDTYSGGADGFGAPRGITPAQYGLRTIAEDQAVLDIWNDTLRWAAKGNNSYTKYLDNPTLANANKAWQETVSPRFLMQMRKAGYDISETHHWNWPRSTSLEHVFDARHLVPIPRNRPGLHWDIHRDLTSHPNPNPSLFPPWDAVGSPIRPEHVIEFPNLSSPIIAQ